jgi:hypothetical protein
MNAIIRNLPLAVALWLVIIVATVVLSVPGCTALTPVQTQIATCNQATDALGALTILRAQNKLSAPVISTVNAALPAYKSVCVDKQAATPSLQALLDSLQSALLQAQTTTGAK